MLLVIMFYEDKEGVSSRRAMRWAWECVPWKGQRDVGCLDKGTAMRRGMLGAR